ncbi:MAG TPA: transglycosylase SLT domain-containing protein [Candidatus Saccharimonadales bacterium]|nr:transglycosylase SLT domain-containing protein [Candidatus Saccharimonadales bacterium]
MYGVRLFGALPVPSAQQLLRCKKAAAATLALLGGLVCVHFVLQFTQPAATSAAVSPPDGFYADTHALYCARYGIQNGSVAAACQASEMTASMMHLQIQANIATNSCRSYDALFRLYNWNVSLAEAICQAESGGNPSAISPTNDYGLMQLHNLAIFDPAQNIAIAYVKYQTQGWGAWTTYNTGAYSRYL